MLYLAWIIHSDHGAIINNSPSYCQETGVLIFDLYHRGLQLGNLGYQIGSAALVEGDAFVDKLIGDKVSGVFVPGFSGTQHARRAIEVAQVILFLTGHADPQGPWAPVWVGVHNGVVYVGVVGSRDGVLDVTAGGMFWLSRKRLVGS
jgi:hypothetical protein